MRKDWVYRRGDLYLADLSPVTGSEQGGVRPVLVIQNNIGNFYAPTLIVAMITTKKKALQPRLKQTRQLLIHERQQSPSQLYNGHFRAEPGVDAAQFNTDHAAAYHQQAVRDVVQGEAVR